MITIISKEQVESLVRQVNTEFKTYFKSSDAAMSSFGWCFLQAFGIIAFDEKEFKLLPKEIRYAARRISVGLSF